MGDDGSNEKDSNDAAATSGPPAARLWSVRELATFLKLTPKGVYGLCERNAIPYIRVGTRLRFEPRAVTAWLRHRRDVRHSRKRR
jgi:excisionase family DNA binding protein